MDDENQYGMMDLTQYLNGRPLFSSVSPDLLCSNQHFDMLMTSTTTTTATTHVPQHENYFPHHHHYHYHHGFHPESSTVAGSTVSGGCALSAMETEGGNGRWPRQETLKLLEVRSQLDSKFKETIQKGPLWDEVSRIMSEEYGYQRSGKKCREKFENLYKYYKKTKDGKAGRQDGKHYRYFRQLEALYGKTSNTINTNTFHQYQVHYNQQPHHCPKVSDDNLYDSSDSDDSDNSSNDDSKRKNSKKKGKRSWKGMISDFMDIQMRKLMEKQDIWLEKMMKTIEDKEKERILREEEWRKKEEIRLEKQQKFWADERAWIEERDAVLIDTLRRLNGEKIMTNSTINYNDEYGSISYCNKKQKEMNSLSSYCETSRHVPNIHDTIDDGYIARIL
ncbi:trihelix transcription factor PTL-like [Solanum pennellii]|uniref:Trihelix transcription factor PTL-like n=1 Tax=Solanum pennellii TaxID=28526 RepID=A0ABM1FDP7_SOLPN|nr:trihelix transcription factor PTL-like [Solanum pennellii]